MNLTHDEKRRTMAAAIRQKFNERRGFSMDEDGFQVANHVLDYWRNQVVVSGVDPTSLSSREVSGLISASFASRRQF